MRLLAVDLGEKRTGLAICDEAETFATPLMVLPGRGDLAARIAEIAKENQVQAIVFGLAMNMDDSEGDQARKTRAFAAEIEKTVNLPIFFQDERLSSFAAEKTIAGRGLTRKKKKKILDAVAAAVILQSFIDDRKESKKSSQNP